MRAEKMNWNSKSSPEGATVSDRETKGTGADESPEPSMARAGCQGEWGSWGDRLIAASSRDNCQHPGENKVAMPRRGRMYISEKQTWRKISIAAKHLLRKMNIGDVQQTPVWRQMLPAGVWTFGAAQVPWGGVGGRQRQQKEPSKGKAQKQAVSTSFWVF